MTPSRPLRRALHRARTTWEIAAARAGLSGPLAGAVVLMAAGAATLQLAYLPTARTALAEARARLALATQQARLAAAQRPPAPASTGPQDLQALLRAAPPVEAQLQAMAARAQGEQVLLSRADYSQRPVPGLPLVQWQVVQPVHARYPQVRRYLEAVLRELPQASLDQVSVRRESVGLEDLEVRLRWSLWLPGPVTGTPARAAAADEPEVALLPRDVLLPTRGAPPLRDLFAVRRWAPDPPPAAALPPAPPAAPALPFTFIGKKLEDGRWEAYVARDDKTLVLREGEIVDGQWRVDRIAPPQLALTYLPLGLPQALTIGDDR